MAQQHGEANYIFQSKYTLCSLAMSKEWSLVLHMIRGITRSCIQDVCDKLHMLSKLYLYIQYASRFLFRSKWTISNYCPYESNRIFTRWPLSKIHFPWFHCHQYADLLSHCEENIAFCKCLMEIVFRQYIEYVDCLLPIVFWWCIL